MFSLSGKTALVTGGGRGIGYDIAFALTEQGADLVLAGRTLHTLEKAAETLHEAYPERRIRCKTCDIGQPATTAAMLQEMDREGIPLDILVNNAALHLSCPIEDMKEEDMQRIIQTNISGLFAICKAALPLIKKRGKGKIINLTSFMSQIGRANIACYSATKAAIRQITRVMAIEWAPYNIQVNGIAPGVIATDFTAGLQQNAPMVEYLKTRIPAGRWGGMGDMGGCAAFLASDEADYVTGTTIVVDGGILASL